MQLLALCLSLGGEATLVCPELNAEIVTGPGDVVLIDAHNVRHTIKNADKGRMSLVLSTHTRFFVPKAEAEVRRLAAKGPRLNIKAQSQVAAQGW